MTNREQPAARRPGRRHRLRNNFRLGRVVDFAREWALLLAGLGFVAVFVIVVLALDAIR